MNTQLRSSKHLSLTIAKNFHNKCVLKMPKQSKSRISQKYLFLPTVPKTYKLSFYQTLILILKLDGPRRYLTGRSYLVMGVLCALKIEKVTELRRERQRILSSRPPWATQQDI